jgi:hypothetical protein
MTSDVFHNGVLNLIALCSIGIVIILLYVICSIIADSSRIEQLGLVILGVILLFTIFAALAFLCQ